MNGQKEALEAARIQGSADQEATSRAFLLKQREVIKQFPVPGKMGSGLRFSKLTLKVALSEKGPRDHVI